MISIKTATIIFLIALCVKPVTSTSPSDPQEPISPIKPSIRVREQRRVSKRKKNVLQDTDAITGVVQPTGDSTGGMVHIRKQSVPSVEKQLENLMDQGDYEKISELGRRMKPDKFLKQLCSAVRTLEQYFRIFDYLEDRKMVKYFYIYGKMEVVGEVIAKSGIRHYYVSDGYLESSLLLAFENGLHDRLINLFSARKATTAEGDKQPVRKGDKTSFERFVFYFLTCLLPWKKNEMAFKQFLTIHMDEFKNRYPDIHETLFQQLISNLQNNLYDLDAAKLLDDLIGQPSLLAPVTFVRGYLHAVPDTVLPKFINYGWQEVIREGLKKDREYGGEKLWLAMKKERPNQFSGDYPETEKALDAVLKHFPTKQKLEIQWIKNNAPGFIEEFDTEEIFPKVLMQIIFEYARPTWLDIEAYNSNFIWTAIKRTIRNIFK